MLSAAPVDNLGAMITTTPAEVAHPVSSTSTTPAPASAPSTQTAAEDRAASLLARARSLRAQSQHVNPVLADAYLRRSAELSLEAWLRAARRAAADVDIDTFTTVAA
jgi:hypothetical protein